MFFLASFDLPTPRHPTLPLSPPLHSTAFRTTPFYPIPPHSNPPHTDNYRLFKCECQSAKPSRPSPRRKRKMRTLRQPWIQVRFDDAAESLWLQFDVAPSSHPSHVDVASFSHRFRIGFFRNSKFFGFHQEFLSEGHSYLSWFHQPPCLLLHLCLNIFQLDPPEQQKLTVDVIVWATKHTERNVSDMVSERNVVFVLMI